MSMTSQDVLSAARELDGTAICTPLLSSPHMDSLLGRSVVIKAESLQLSGSFKLRGAFTALARLSPRARRRGVIAASSGNHGHALALAGTHFDTPVTVVVPHDAPSVKLRAIRELGARVITYHRRRQHRDAIVDEWAQREQLTVVPSADSEAVVAGAGTAAWELLQQAPELTAILVPVGGGGLAAGTALAAHTHDTRIRVIGVEPSAADDTCRSLHAGRRVCIAPPVTIADGLGHIMPAPIPWEINQRLLHRVVTVSEQDIVRAMALLWRHYSSRAEASGATAFAGLLACADRLPPGPVGVILSGGNVDWPTYRTLLTSAFDRTEHKPHAPSALLR
ncbi:threonine/serine dehydratase [Streptomyces sp. NPDC091292]|uniref:threonine ammonia-lyase n=1 Tax=Streptomyces sp. NPDC091292 TaxID=3365991 RepID=UPI00380428F6